MTAMEVVEKVKKSGTVGGVDDEMLYTAVERLEIMIQKYTGKPNKEFDAEEPLLACGGGVEVGYDDMYDLYAKREACYIREDWECFGNYDALFKVEWEKFKKEYLRNNKPAGQGFSPDWRWN